MRKRKKLKPRAVLPRVAARHEIIAAANDRLPLALVPYSMRRLNEAVFKCRQLALVDADVLVLAGFRSKRRSN